MGVSITGIHTCVGSGMGGGVGRREYRDGEREGWGGMGWGRERIKNKGQGKFGMKGKFNQGRDNNYREFRGK